MGLNHCSTEEVHSEVLFFSGRSWLWLFLLFWLLGLRLLLLFLLLILGRGSRAAGSNLGESPGDQLRVRLNTS
jgi:hypothetical protein